MLEILTSPLLSTIDGVRFGMSVRYGGVSAEPYALNLSYKVGDDPDRVTTNRRLFFERLGIGQEQLALPTQCHSATVLAVERGGNYDQCDGLVTATAHLWLAVSVADCVPIVLVDPQRRVVAALHAGWRGTVQRIVERGITLMVESFNTRPADLRVYLGPSASVCCYEVGEEVFSKFTDEVLVRRNGAVHVDLKKENKQQLMDCGVLEEHIEVSPWCTICTPRLFHSYRRDGNRSGRMMAAIALIS